MDSIDKNSAFDSGVGASSILLSDEQKRQLRAVRRGYRAESVAVKNDGWDLEIRFMDGSTATVSAKAIKLRSIELSSVPDARK